MYPPSMRASNGVVQPVDPTPLTTDGQLSAGVQTAGVPTIAAGAGVNTGTVALEAPYTDHAGYIDLNPTGAPVAGILATVTLSQPLTTWAVPVTVEESGTGARQKSATSGFAFPVQLTTNANGQITGFNLLCQTALTAGKAYRVFYAFVGVPS